MNLLNHHSVSVKDTNFSNKGILLALLIIISWAALIYFALLYETNFTNPWNIFLILVLTHLYTGLFITAHDSIHGTISSSQKVNEIIGRTCVILYACFPYTKIRAKHHQHHNHVATEEDPDFHTENFFLWFLNFMKNYLELRQIIILAVLYNVLKFGLGINELNLVLFWVIPPILSSLQLFYFGTYLPHRKPETIQNEQRSRTLNVNTFWGFVTCYFFGYHYEHHSKPHVPWWRLWKEKV